MTRLLYKWKFLPDQVVLNLGTHWNHLAATVKSLQLCLTLCDPIDGSPPGSSPWDSPGKNTGVGCHFLLQRIKVKSESEVAQLCPTLHDSMDCSLPGSSTHGMFQARVLEWVAIAFSWVAIKTNDAWVQLPEIQTQLVWGTPRYWEFLKLPR